MSYLAGNSASVSVVIPAYGECPHLSDVVGAVLGGTTQPLEVIVSHSGREDPSEALKARFSDITVLHSDERHFAGAARNRGAAIAKGAILAFCDADTRPEADWLGQIAEAFHVGSNLFVVGAVGMARRGGYWGMSNWLLEFSEQAPWRSPGEQTGGASCNMAVRTEDFRGIGGFRDDMRGGEDTTLFAKLRQKGLRQRFCPKAVVGHFNNPGVLAFARHQAGLGASFAEVRRDLDMPGHQFVRRPILALFLCMPKAFLVLRRTMVCGPRAAANAIFLMPGVVLGSLIWSFACFRRARTLNQSEAQAES